MPVSGGARAKGGYEISKLKASDVVCFSPETVRQLGAGSERVEIVSLARRARRTATPRYLDWARLVGGH